MRDILKGVVYAGVFAVPFVVLLVTGSLFFPYITGKNIAFRVIVEIIFAAWVLLMLYDASYRPRFSWIAVSGLAFLGVMFFANLFGEYPLKSFWSNFERMDGYVTLVHFYVYFLVVGTMLKTEQHWRWFLHTTLGVAIAVCFYAFAQISGTAEISQGSWRVDSTLGNSTYMAIYMLFHIFIAAWLFAKTSSRNMRYGYAVLIVLFTYMLLQTGTRGATLGLVGGGILTTLYVALFARGYPKIRRIAAGGLLVVTLLVGLFMSARHTEFIQNTPILDRIADITLAEGSVRFMVWSVAWEGIKERPLLGWGQENFSYVFNKHYVPGLYDAEPWYDRTHNIVFDWLVAGGVLGALAYFSIIGAALFYIFVRPLWLTLRHGAEDETFSVVERGLLLGLLGAYVFHNLFVFDNIVSYIFFAVVLALIHARVARAVPSLEQWSVDRRLVDRVAVPCVSVLLAVTVYAVNVPGLLAARDVIDAFKMQTVGSRMDELERAFERSDFGKQEVAEQTAKQVIDLTKAGALSAQDKHEYIERAASMLTTMNERKPNDPRFHLFLAGLYVEQGRAEDAARELAWARELSPEKPSIIIEQGILELQRQNFAAMYDHFKTAYELAPTYPRAAAFYASALILNNETEAAADVLAPENALVFAESEIARLSVAAQDAVGEVASIFGSLANEFPNDPRVPTAHALFLYVHDRPNEAINVLESAQTDLPTFSDVAACYIKNIERDASMLEGC